MSDDTPANPDGTMNGAKVAPNSVFMGLVGRCREHLAVLTNGLSVSMAAYPKEIQLAAMAAAFGEVLSEASQSEVVQQTMVTRSKIREVFKQALTQYRPALQLQDPTALFKTPPQL